MKPTAAPAVWPYPDHRTMAQVFDDWAMGCRCRRTRAYGHHDSCKLHQWREKRRAMG